MNADSINELSATITALIALITMIAGAIATALHKTKDSRKQIRHALQLLLGDDTDETTDIVTRLDDITNRLATIEAMVTTKGDTS